MLADVTLDRALQRECESRGIALSDGDVDAERQRLTEALSQGATGGGDRAAALLDASRATRGLGPARFPALLARNARLRKLVHDDVSIADADIDRELAVRHGPKVRARVVVVPTERLASEIRSRLGSAGSEAGARFAAEALAHSTDTSAPAGGLTPAFSLDDPAVPAALRTALRDTARGEITPVLAVDTGFAIALHEGDVPAEASPPPRDVIEARLRVRRERIAMDRLAQSMLNASSITVLDESLGWSWDKARPGAAGR